MPTFSPVIELLPELQVARLDVAELFGRNAPLHVDLGCGDGSFLCEMAQQFPKRNFLGIERLTKRVEKVRRKAEKIENVRVLRADTLFAVRYLLPEYFSGNFLSFVSRPMAEAAASVPTDFHARLFGCNRRCAGETRCPARRDRSVRLFSSNRTAKPRSPAISSCPAVAGRCRSSGNQVRKKISRAGRADLSADASKDFAGQISSRAPFVA